MYSRDAGGVFGFADNLWWIVLHLSFDTSDGFVSSWFDLLPQFLPHLTQSDRFIFHDNLFYMFCA